MQERKKRLLVLGIGNYLCGDDGIGPILAERLMHQYMGDEDVDVMNGGTIGLGLLYLFESYANVLFLDAVDIGAKPGTVYRYTPDDLDSQQGGERVSVHQSDPCELLLYARSIGNVPDNVVILGIQIEKINSSIGLSESLENHLPSLENTINHEIRAILKQCTNCH